MVATQGRFLVFQCRARRVEGRYETLERAIAGAKGHDVALIVDLWTHAVRRWKGGTVELMTPSAHAPERTGPPWVLLAWFRNAVVGRFDDLEGCRRRAAGVEKTLYVAIEVESFEVWARERGQWVQRHGPRRHPADARQSALALEGEGAEGA